MSSQQQGERSIELSEVDELKHKIMNLEEKLQQREKELIWLKSEKKALTKELNSTHCLRYELQIEPPEIHKDRPITIILSEIFNLHVDRSRVSVQEWTTKDWNCSANFESLEVMEVWNYYEFCCTLFQIPEDERMFIDLNEEDCTVNFVFPHNIALKKYTFAPQPN